MVEWILVVVLHGETTMFSRKEFEYTYKSNCIKDVKVWKETRPNVVSAYCKKSEK